VDDEVGAEVVHILAGHVLAGRKIAVPPLKTENLVRISPSLKLLDERAPDEARSACDQDLHRRRVYWAALLATSLALVACGGHKAATTSQTTTGSGPFFALDAQHQRLVSDYEPVSRKLYDYEVAFRRRQSGAISRKELRAAARDLRTVVRTSIRRIRGDSATGATAAAKHFLLEALEVRGRALDELVTGSDRDAYRRNWDRSVVLAREALTKLQDIRDRARLIPLPEDSVS
jgi:hypothetical protein